MTFRESYGDFSDLGHFEKSGTIFGWAICVSGASNLDIGSVEVQVSISIKLFMTFCDAVLDIRYKTWCLMRMGLWEGDDWMRLRLKQVLWGIMGNLNLIADSVKPKGVILSPFT